MQSQSREATVAQSQSLVTVAKRLLPYFVKYAEPQSRSRLSYIAAVIRLARVSTLVDIRLKRHLFFKLGKISIE